MKAAKIVLAAAFVCALLTLAPQRASAETIAALPQVEHAEYPDLPKGHWAYKVLERITWLFPHRLIEGRVIDLYDGTQPLTRYDMAVAIARLLGKAGNDPEKFLISRYASQPAIRLEVMDALTALCTEFRVELDRIGVTNLRKWQLQ